MSNIKADYQTNLTGDGKLEIIIIILGVFIDRVTKMWAVTNLSKGTDVVIINNLFSLSYLENRGAAFGIFQGRAFLLSLLTVIVLLAMVFYLIRYKPKSFILKVSLALIISGAIGNLIDRIKYKYVVDFIFFHYKDVYSFPTFNIADVLVVIGTFLLAVFIIKDGE
ncbi:lipoprotein signal peptidase [Clostridium putrefaciens]|uniref:Lipoprotein signal peptidase n=1 Tax=Clostridium putrefaciens TaxID=99675 RepID=A0A381JA11_9CLOT|nr:lipoprotein signal peptidase [Clostridium putrefaciens]